MGGLRGGGKQTDVWWNSNPPPISFSFSALLLLCICLIIISRLPFTFSFFSFCTYVNCIVFSENVIINLNVLNTKKKAWKKLVYLESVCHRVPWRPAASGPPPALFQHTNCLMRDRRGKWRADDPDWLFHPSASCHSFCHVLRMAVVARVTIAAVWGRVTHPGHVAPPLFTNSFHHPNLCVFGQSQELLENMQTPHRKFPGPGNKPRAQQCRPGRVWHQNI